MSGKDGNSDRTNLFESEEPIEWAKKISGATATGGFQAIDFTYTENYPGAGTFIKSHGVSGQLSIYRQSKSKWIQSLFPAGKTTMLIGSVKEKNDIAIEDDGDVNQIQTAIVYLGNTIFIIDRGEKSITCVNGIRTPSAMLDDKNPILLSVGRTNFLIRPKNSIPVKERSIENAFLVKTQSGEQRAEFGRCNLIGSHNACDLKVEGTEFAGMIIPFEKNLYLIPLEITKCNGMEIPPLQPFHLAGGSTIDSMSASIIIPEGLTDGNVHDFRTQVPESLKLIEILESEKQGSIRVRLPKSGYSFIISRKKDNNSLFIGSESISRKHAQVIVYDKSIMVEDLGSKNGSFINGERIKRKRMYPGDFLSVGDRTFLLGYSLIDENEKRD